MPARSSREGLCSFRSYTAQLGRPWLNWLHDAPPSTVRKTPMSVPAYIVVSAAGSIASELTGMSGRREGAVPLMSVQVATPAASIAPLQTCPVPKPDMTTTIVLGAPGTARTSHIQRAGRGGEFIAAAVQFAPASVSLYTLPVLVPA